MIRRGIGGVGRVGRPGLLGTMARTAVVAGTATAVSGGMIRHQQERAQEQQDAQSYRQQQVADQQYAAQVAAEQQAAAPQAAPAAGGAGDLIAQLKELAALKEQGILTDAEFEAQKQKLLNA